MSSLLVHIALAGLFSAALLAHEFDWRALVVAALAVFVVDLDAFLTPVIQSAHRAAGHTLVWPAVLAVVLIGVSRLDPPSGSADRAEPASADRSVVDRVRTGGVPIVGPLVDRLRTWWASVAATIVAVRSPRRIRLAWVSLAVVVFAGIGPDLFSNGVNLFWPIHDQFYAFDGRIEYSTTRGLVQTVVDFSPERATVSTTENTFYSTGIDPTPGADPANVERVFPIAWSGLEILLLIASTTVVGVRLAWNRRRKH